MRPAERPRLVTCCAPAFSLLKSAPPACWCSAAPFTTACRIKTEKSGVGKGEIVSSAFGADYPVKIGRVDSNVPDPAGRIPSADASVEEIQARSAAADSCACSSWPPGPAAC